ncbi:hypothetical protein CDFC105_73478 [Clostridioides difficile]|nr:hypothetical protein CDFC105_62437 [Clostridioides difficile]CZS10359.1 hypothetical protein CDFC105_73478 [Clostridioides difficile]
MLNEDVVKNINKLNNEQDNINLELSKKASKEDLDKLIQGGTNVAISKDISTDDWTIEEGTYTTTVEHNLVTRKVLVSLIDKTTNNNVFCSYQILDDNRIKAFNESNNELECIVVNGNSAINMVSATIDDNRSAETTTYSSIKVEALLKVLENKIDDIENLKEVDNIECITKTGEYTIENSKKGYITNFNIEGKTLVNLASTNMFIVEGNSTKEGVFIKLNNSAAYVKLLNRLNTGVYTLIVNVTDINVSYTIHTILSGGGNKEVFTKNGNQVLKLNMDNNIDKLRVYTADSSNALNIQMLLLEGDYTNKDVPYFDGLQSVGQGGNIEILSYKSDGNLFYGEFRNGSYVEDGSFYADNNATSNKSFIRVDEKKKYSISYNLDITGKIFEYDKNKKYIKSTSITNEDSFTTSESTKYINFFVDTNSVGYSPDIKFMFNVGELKEYRPYKYDKKIIPYTLRSLPNGVRDEIVYKNNGYKLIQRCEEITLNGNETWGIHTSIEKTNTMVFVISIGIINHNGDICILSSDKFKPVSANILANCDYECIANGGNTGYETMIRIAKTKADSLETFKTWLKSNNITVVYPLQRPQEIKFVDLSMQTFEGKTKFLLATGNILPKVGFEVTQNFVNNIEILKSKINTLENIYTYSKTIDLSDKLLNGWKKAYDIHQGLILSKIGKVVQISSVIKDGLFTAGTIIVYLPKEFTPSKIAPIQIFDNGESLGSLEIRPEGYIKIAIVNKNSTRIIFNGSYILD